jgi:hypothetical protein
MYLRYSIRLIVSLSILALAVADASDRLRTRTGASHSDTPLNSIDAKAWFDRWIEIAGTELAAEMISADGLRVTIQSCDGEQTELLTKGDWSRTDFNFLSVYSEIDCEESLCRVTAPGESYSLEFGSESDGSVFLVAFSGFADISPGDCSEE